MAYINNIYVFVQSEKINKGVEVSSHPVERGLEISDNVKRNPLTLSLEGAIVGKNAKVQISALTQMMNGGNLISYSGVNILKDCIIESFETGYTNQITGGCSFTMTLREIRIANSAYTPTKTSSKTKKPTQNGTQQVQKKRVNVYHTVKKGDTLWSIAVQYYGDGSRFDEIYHANRTRMPRMAVLNVGTALYIP